MRPINTNFTRLFYGLAISTLGNYLFDTTVVLWIGTRLLAHKSYAPAAVAGVLVAVALGAFVISPIAGVLVDRWDKRRTMMGSDLIRAGLAAVLVVAALLPSGALPAGATLVLIYVVVFASTAVSTFFTPANFTFIGDIVPDNNDRAKASSLTQSASSVAAIIGPPLAAPLLFTTGVYWALIINALSFLVSFAMVYRIKVPRDVRELDRDPADVARLTMSEESEVEAISAKEPSFKEEFLAGIRFVSRSRVIRVILVAITVVTLGSGALSALDVFFVTANLHVSAHWYGTLGMGEGIGALVGSLLAAWACRRIGDVRVLWAGLIAIGVGTAIYSRLTDIFAAVTILAILALPLGAVNVAVSPIVLRSVPREMIGRVVSVFTPFQTLASVVSAVASGWLVSTVLENFHHTVLGIKFGAIDTVFFAAALLIIGAGIYAAVGLRSAATVTKPSEAPITEPAGV